MSTITLNDFLRDLCEGDQLEPEMRPDRIGGGKLITAKFGVELDGAAASCLGGASSTATSNASSGVSKKLDTAAAKRFLRWMADSLDTDTPNLEIEVVSANGNTRAAQAAAQRLSEQASA